MASTGGHDSSSPAVDSPKLIRTFRDQMHALGALWIIIGLLAGGASVVALLGNPDVAARVGGGVRAVLFITAALGVTWVVLGVMTCLKHMWAVYVGLGLSYLSLVGNLINLNVCAVVIVLIVILQAHRVMKMAKEMTAAGLALTSRPQ